MAQNRCLKLQAYDKADKKIYPVYQMSLVDSGAIKLAKNITDYSKNEWQSFGEVELREWTGLKDKNGLTEIYEGDIFKSGAGLVYEVVWWDGKSAWATKDRFGGYGMLWPEVKQWDEVKVIGNVWENPELLSKNYEEN